LNLRSAGVMAAVLVMGAAAVGYTFNELGEARAGFAAEVSRAQEAAVWMKANQLAYTHERVPSGVPLADLLARMGVERAAVNHLVAEAQRAFDLRKVRAGNAIALLRRGDGTVRALRYDIDAERLLWVMGDQQGYRARIEEVPFTTEVVTVAGTVQNSLFNAVADAGEKPELAIVLADIFGWDLDFYTDPRVGDTFKVVLEKKTSRASDAVLYGKVLAAEYRNAGHPYQAVLFREPSGEAAYYGPDGKSLKKAFLKSPLKFAAPITSRFSHNRLHPVLKRHRPHLGTDYGAPTGTPVQAVGDGKVMFAGRKGGAGNMVHLRHANGFETMYLHLSRIFVRSGQQVPQGKVIGAVGATGLATGAHLDFRVRQNGAFRNFETLKLPPALPVAAADMAEFAQLRDRFMGMMETAQPTVARVSAPTATDTD
jgi:murein DD-endopeptidase MepM/ murein hydrolase activator NlpD